jgi:uncharacterized protein (UPF0332 family)
MENSMQSNDLEVIKTYIEKSKEALSHAKYNIDGYNLSTAQNRIYYACFYIVKSLSLLDNFITSKHKVLLDWFNNKYVYEKKIFSKELFDIYRDAFDDRTDADYSINVIFTKDQVVENYEKVKSFIEIIEKHILERIGYL